MNLSAIIPLWLLLRESKVFSPDRKAPVHFAQPITIPTLTSEEAGKLYVTGVGEKDPIMSWVQWSALNPGKPITDYHKYVTAFS